MPDFVRSEPALWVFASSVAGSTRLREEGRLDLSAEARVLKPESEPLSTEDERAAARRLLCEFRYK